MNLLYKYLKRERLSIIESRSVGLYLKVFCSVYMVIWKIFESFSNFVLQFYLKHFDHEETSLDEYPALQTQAQWGNAVLAELEKFQEIEGTFIQCR